jgi:hypothetical protein
VIRMRLPRWVTTQRARRCPRSDRPAVREALGDIHEFTGTLGYPRGSHIPMKSLTVLQTGPGSGGARECQVSER